jgi:glycosyltransferase involved in cell wall biosynthesis
MRKLLRIFKSTHVKKLLARFDFTDAESVKYGNSALLELVVRSRGQDKSLLHFFLFSIFSFLFRIRIWWLYLQTDLLILPADIWDQISSRMRRRTILEIRWLTQDLIDSLEIPELDFHRNIESAGSGIPIMSKKVFQDFRGFVTYSEIAKESIELSGADPDKILVFPLLEKDASKLSNKVSLPRQNRFLYVGRSAPDKRLDLAVRVAQELNIPIDIVGKYSKATVEWLNRQQCVNFIGTIPHNEVLKLMETNRTFLAPGAESWGLAVVEALQSGMEVYASRYTGVTEWISHPNLHKISEMNAELFVQEFRLAIPDIGVHKIFHPYDFDASWKGFLAKLDY